MATTAETPPVLDLLEPRPLATSLLPRRTSTSQLVAATVLGRSVPVTLRRRPRTFTGPIVVFELRSQASPLPLPFQSTCVGLGTVVQLSRESGRPSPSVSTKVSTV